MPFKNAQFTHLRRRPPSTIEEGSYYTVPVSHTKATGKYPRGTIARIGTSIKTGKVVIQAILIPINKRKKTMKRKAKKLDKNGKPTHDYRGKKWDESLGRYVYT